MPAAPLSACTYARHLGINTGRVSLATVVSTQVLCPPVRVGGCRSPIACQRPHGPRVPALATSVSIQVAVVASWYQYINTQYCYHIVVSTRSHGPRVPTLTTVVSMHTSSCYQRSPSWYTTGLLVSIRAAPSACTYVRHLGVNTRVVTSWYQ